MAFLLSIEITTASPGWFILFCILCGAAASLLLYYRNRSLKEVSRFTKSILAATRFITVFLLSFLLMSPFIKITSKEVEKPLIILAQDESRSLLLCSDSSFYRSEYPRRLMDFARALGKKYDVRIYSFGSKVKEGADFTYMDPQTGLSALLDEAYNRFTNRNTGALIIASDGIYNTGENPLYAAPGLRPPVYTIALGDTTVKKDLVLSKVNYNRQVFLGDNFPLEILVDARRCGQSSSLLSVKEDSSVLFTKEIFIGSGNFHTTVSAVMEAKKKGIHHYRLELSPLEGEAGTLNNVQDIFVEVIENRQKILVVAPGPHPDLAALKESIESSPNYEVSICMTGDPRTSEVLSSGLKHFQLLVLYQIPAREANPDSRIFSSGIPVLYVLGAQSSINTFNDMKKGFSVSQNLGKVSEVQPYVSEDFSLFTLGEETAKKINSFPPLLSPFGTYRITGSAYSLLRQQSGMVKTAQPLLCFIDDGGQRCGILAGEGLWRWRLHEFAEGGDHRATDELLTKTVQYLSAKEDKRPFRVLHKNIFREDEALLFDAELYDQSHEPVNTPEVGLSVTGPGGEKFNYTFSRAGRTYTLSTGRFPVGNYSFLASVKTGDKMLQARGFFTVSPVQAEALETVADHGLLYRLAKKHGGEMVYPSGLEKLRKMIEDREDIRPVSYSRKQLQDIINIKWIFFLLIVLLSAEWFLRKRNGGY